MKVHNARFLCAAKRLAACPDTPFPEFSFIGRSNVGKSSLINWLTHKGGLARVSKTPGRTREINFFVIDDRWTMVDLPGFGFAKVSKSERETFNQFVSDYLLNRSNLLGTFLLIDSRHSPQKSDLEFAAWLVECRLPFALIFTKIDKSKSKAVERNINQFCEAMSEFSDGKPPVFQSSTKSREGKADILAFIDEAICSSQ